MIAVVEPFGGSIEAIDDPSPASQPAVVRMTIGAPCSAIVATDWPSADVARSRSPLGPSVCLPSGVDDRRDGRTGVAADHDEPVVVDPDRWRRDDGLIQRDLEGRPAGVDEHDAHVVAGKEIAGEHRVAAAVGLPGAK